MKKSLLFAAFLMGAMSVNAQTEICFSDVDNAGLTSDGAIVAGETVVGQSDNVTMKLAYEDTWKASGIDFQGYTGAIVNGTEVTFATGVVGSTNPSGQSLVEGASTPATSGAVLQFEVKKDGYLTVFGKLSSNKEYYVWEGDAVYAEPMAYTLAMDFSAAALEGTPSIVYTIPADENGYLDFAAADIEKYVNGTKYYWPEKTVLGADAADVKKNGTGAIIFPVFAEAGSYLVHAAGSKITTCGAVFTTEPVTELTLTGEAEGAAISLALISNGSTGISGIVSDAENTNAPVYNLAGQRVNKNAKGILIQNGKKFINK